MRGGSRRAQLAAWATFNCARGALGVWAPWGWAALVGMNYTPAGGGAVEDAGRRGEGYARLHLGRLRIL